MPTIVSLGLCLIRISNRNPAILEFSDNAGINWHTRFAGSLETGNFLDIFRRGETVFATTTTGRFRSVDGAASWMKVD